MILGVVGMIVGVVGNGEMAKPEKLSEQVNKCDYVIAVDGGMRHCDAMGIRPNFWIGDFDSASDELQAKYKDVEQQRVPREKDQTDLELGVEKAWSLGAEVVVLFGVLGGRSDHALYNLNLLARKPGKLRIETESETLYAITDQVVISCDPGQTVSLLPLAEKAEGVSSKGLKWELRNAVFDKNFMSISNTAMASQIEVSIRKGVLLLCLNKGNS